MNQSQQVIEALKTSNPEHGFYGSIKQTTDFAVLSDKEAAELFDHAGQELIKRMKADGQRFGEKQAKQWLDSAMGRHLAEDLSVTRPNVPELKKALTKTISTAPWIIKKAGQP